MDKTVMIFCLIFCQMTFGQFAIIADKDGYVNVRTAAGTSSNITDTIKNGQIVFCFEAENDWRPIDYNLNVSIKSGYVHSSRLKFICGFKEITRKSLTGSTVIFEQDSIKVMFTKKAFNQKTDALEYGKEGEWRYLKKINGKEIYGTDGNIPKMQYGEINVFVNGNKILLPAENLFEPNLDYTTVNYDSENKRIYITTYNSDAAGAYAVLWIIENGKFKDRIITIPF